MNNGMEVCVTGELAASILSAQCHQGLAGPGQGAAWAAAGLSLHMGSALLKVCFIHTSSNLANSKLSMIKNKTKPKNRSGSHAWGRYKAVTGIRLSCPRLRNRIGGEGSLVAVKGIRQPNSAKKQAVMPGRIQTKGCLKRNEAEVWGWF